MSDEREIKKAVREIKKAVRENLSELVPLNLKMQAGMFGARLDVKERKIHRAIADFQTLATWIDNRCFDLDACRALCVAAIESLEAKAEGK